MAAALHILLNYYSPSAMLAWCGEAGGLIGMLELSTGAGMVAGWLVARLVLRLPLERRCWAALLVSLALMSLFHPPLAEESLSPSPLKAAWMALLMSPAMLAGYVLTSLLFRMAQVPSRWQLSPDKKVRLEP